MESDQTTKLRRITPEEAVLANNASGVVAQAMRATIMLILHLVNHIAEQDKEFMRLFRLVRPREGKEFQKYTQELLDRLVQKKKEDFLFCTEKAVKAINAMLMGIYFTGGPDSFKDMMEIIEMTGITDNADKDEQMRSAKETYDVELAKIVTTHGE
jgi:hypothetical protein